MWVHPSAVIKIPVGSGNINTTIQTINREVVPTIVSCSGSLIEVDSSWLTSGVHPILFVNTECVCDTYRPSYFSSACYPIPSETFSKRSGHKS